MNRLRLDLLRRTNGVIFQQFFSNEAAPPLREPAPIPANFARAHNSRYYKVEDPAETIRHITMNPVDIVNSAQHDNENEFLYKYVHQKLVERYTPVNQESVFDSQICQHVRDLLHILSRRMPGGDVKKLSDTIREQVHSSNLNELEWILTALKGRRGDVIRSIVRVIDLKLDSILKYSNDLQLSQLDKWFYMADLLYESRIKTISNKTLTSFLARDLKESDVSNQQLLHLLFLIILERQSNYLLQKYEKRIINMLGGASIEDLSIICLAYFKTKTLIKDRKMLDKIVNQTKKNLPKLDPTQPAYCSIVKSLRYSRDPEHRAGVNKLISALLEDPKHQVMFGSAYNAVHTIKLMEAYRIYEPKMLHILRCLIFRDLSDFRIKDIQYALTSLSNFSYMDLKPDERLAQDFDKLIDNIVDHKRPDLEHQNYHLIPILRAFVLFGFHSSKIMSYALRVLSDKTQVMRMNNVLEFDKSTLLIHAANAIEHGDTSLLNVKPLLDHCSSTIGRHGNSGSIIQNESMQHLDSVLKGFRRKHKPNSAMFRSMAECLVNHEYLKNSSYKFNFQFTFPHQNYSDLVVTKDCPEPGSFDPETLLPRPVPTQTKSCLVFATQKTDFIDGHSRLCGYKHLLIRMMEKLGYFVLPVDLHEPNVNWLANRLQSILNS